MSPSQKVAIVTGAAQGIGLAIAQRLSDKGSHIVLADLDGESAVKAAAAITEKGGARALGCICDVGDPKQVASCVDAAIEHFGSFDTIVNNAGMMRFKSLAEWTADEWLAILRVDLLGAAFFTGEAMRRMNSGGSIVNISSVHALRTSDNTAPYAAAKAALLSLTRSAAIEGRVRNIRANAILPGAIDTDMLWQNPNVRSGVERIEKADIGSADDVAAAVAFLASDDARFITGTTIAVDGGRLARL